jgi:NAD(P)-dependent dehydrogenase (short-subunit alcohol dehydrogenase family)
MELEGQAAIVTGAGRGIGRAIALELASMGAAVVVADVSSELAEGTAREVVTRGGRGLALPTDVSKRDDRSAMARRTMAAFGRIDILVNNAGIFRRAAPLEIAEAQWDAVMDVNAKAVLFCSQAVLPQMVAAGRGLIINIASQSGKIGSPTALVYCASKAAVISMTKSLALGFAGQGIRVNCVCPGSVDTDMWADIDYQVGVVELGLPPGEYRRRRATEIPLGRLARPEDVAQVVGVLASSKASYMTGQAINVTGGVIMY